MLELPLLSHRKILALSGSQHLRISARREWRDGGVYEVSGELAYLQGPKRYTAGKRGEIEFGDVVVIAGAGTLGLGMVGAARLKNPGLLISVDLVDSRLEIAKKLGADLAINLGKEDAVQKVLDLTEGYGCDVYIEATGYPSAVEQGLRMIRKAGTFVEFSVMREPVTVDWTIIGDTKELNIHGAHLGPHAYPLAIDYIHRGLINVSPIVTHQLPLAEYIKGFEMVQAAKNSIKVQLVPFSRFTHH